MATVKQKKQSKEKTTWREMRGYDAGWMGVRSKEWHAAWKGLAEGTGDFDFRAECPRTGEAWQYMGSDRRTGQWEHHFRHRNHPATNAWTVVRVAATDGWKPARLC